MRITFSEQSSGKIGYYDFSKGGTKYEKSLTVYAVSIPTYRQTYLHRVGRVCIAPLSSHFLPTILLRIGLIETRD